MQKGTIKDFKETENYGFITPESGKDIHFSRRAVQQGPHPIAIGAPVEFETGPGRKPGEVTATKVIVTGSATATRLPREALFRDTFFGEDNCLKTEMFFSAAKAIAQAFRDENLTATQFRQVYQGFLAFAGPLRDKRMDFARARERFGIFYCERIVRQVERRQLPVVVKEFFDVHRDIAMHSREEMLGLFRYVTNIYCYFGDTQEEKARR